MGAKPNVQIMDTLLNRAYGRFSVVDVQRFLVICENERIPVNKRLLDRLEVFYQKYRSLIKLKVKSSAISWQLSKRDYARARA